MSVEVSTKKRMLFLAGRSNMGLASEIADLLGTGLAKIEVSDFANGEIYVRSSQNLRGADVFIFQSHVAPINDHIMEQLIMVDAARRASAKRITAVVPFYGYARQDRKSRGREPITARLIADMFTAAGVDRVLSVDLHADQIQGFFNKPFDHLTALPLLADHLKDRFGPECVIVTPDAGRIRVAEKFASRLGAGLAILHKRRRTDVRNQSETALEVIGDVDGRICVLVDDMIDTAGTLCGAAQVLTEFGASEVYAAATHALLSGPAIDRLKNSVISETIVTNTVPISADRMLPNLTVLSIAPVVADTIRAVFNEQSVSEIFDGEN